MCKQVSYRSIVCWLAAGKLAFFSAAISVALAQDVPPPPPPSDPNLGAAAAPAADPNVEVLTRGPVHEAYAAPVAAGQATGGMVVQKQPPTPVEEMPPDMRPEGDKAVWIPGYWSWDDDRKDYIWVSGVWRVPPPGFRWMPGYWQDNQGQGYQWISGYWMPAQIEETTFLPQPPQQNLENGPTSEQPDANHFWVPGQYQWHETRYVWQPGYWSVCQPDWIWVPAKYYWCPSGWVYVPGYWDYPLARRGIVFSPVYFARPVAYYRPAVCLDVGVLSFSLFSRPAYCHYYFGDYYDDRYVALGIRPWFYYGSHRHGYDPLYGYYRWYHVDHLHEREWANHLAGWHTYYRTHPDMRPPHTWEAQRALLASGAARARPDFQQLHFAQDVHHLDARAAGAMKLQQVPPAQHAQLAQAARQTVHFQQERQQFERRAATGVKGPSQPTRASLTNMPTFKSNTLPGASPGNVKAAINRPAGIGAANASTAQGQLNSAGRFDRRDPGNRGAAGAATTGNTTGSAVGTPRRPGFNPAGAGAAAATPSGGAAATGAAATGRTNGGAADPGRTPSFNPSAAGARAAGGATGGATGGPPASGGQPAYRAPSGPSPGGATGGSPASGGQPAYRTPGGPSTGGAAGGYSGGGGRAIGPAGAPPSGRGAPSSSGGSGRGSSGGGRGDDRSRDKDRGRN